MCKKIITQLNLVEKHIINETDEFVLNVKIYIIRITRGLFKSNKGIKINADVNASYNIMRKVVPDVFVDGIEGVSDHPIKINF